ncbi:hypothetical protein JG688_00004437 [Phytophthora aleatoria]|uniref:Uncharacterized protein n=1 Tax=Phytophthora aleatoria TaxID=2496075 RepID=A0A8J5IWU2_9STRA|nr:hypothetical protein JG688_00004437 [Phytophthora aleatoria]
MFLRLFEDVRVAVARSKQSRSSRLMCEWSFQVATDSTTFELELELVAAPNCAVPLIGVAALVSSNAGID